MAGPSLEIALIKDMSPFQNGSFSCHVNNFCRLGISAWAGLAMFMLGSCLFFLLRTITFYVCFIALYILLIILQGHVKTNPDSYTPPGGPLIRKMKFRCIPLMHVFVNDIESLFPSNFIYPERNMIRNEMLTLFYSKRNQVFNVLC